LSLRDRINHHMAMAACYRVMRAGFFGDTVVYCHELAAFRLKSRLWFTPDR